MNTSILLESNSNPYQERSGNDLHVGVESGSTSQQQSHDFRTEYEKEVVLNRQLHDHNNNIYQPVDNRFNHIAHTQSHPVLNQNNHVNTYQHYVNVNPPPALSHLPIHYEDVIKEDGTKKRRRTNYKDPENQNKLNAALNSLINYQQDGDNSKDLKSVSKLYNLPYNTLRDNFLKATTGQVQKAKRERKPAASGDEHKQPQPQPQPQQQQQDKPVTQQDVPLHSPKTMMQIQALQQQQQQQQQLQQQQQKQHHQQLHHHQMQQQLQHQQQQFQHHHQQQQQLQPPPVMHHLMGGHPQHLQQHQLHHLPQQVGGDPSHPHHPHHLQHQQQQQFFHHQQQMQQQQALQQNQHLQHPQQGAYAKVFYAPSQHPQLQHQHQHQQIPLHAQHQLLHHPHAQPMNQHLQQQQQQLHALQQAPPPPMLYMPPPALNSSRSTDVVDNNSSGSNSSSSNVERFITARPSSPHASGGALHEPAVFQRGRSGDHGEALAVPPAAADQQGTQLFSVHTEPAVGGQPLHQIHVHPSFPPPAHGQYQHYSESMPDRDGSSQHHQPQLHQRMEHHQQQQAQQPHTLTLQQPGPQPDQQYIASPHMIHFQQQQQQMQLGQHPPVVPPQQGYGHHQLQLPPPHLMYAPPSKGAHLVPQMYDHVPQHPHPQQLHQHQHVDVQGLAGRQQQEQTESHPAFDVSASQQQHRHHDHSSQQSPESYRYGAHPPEGDLSVAAAATGGQSERRLSPLVVPGMRNGSFGPGLIAVSSDAYGDYLRAADAALSLAPPPPPPSFAETHEVLLGQQRLPTDGYYPNPLVTTGHAFHLAEGGGAPDSFERPPTADLSLEQHFYSGPPHQEVLHEQQYSHHADFHAQPGQEVVEQTQYVEAAEVSAPRSSEAGGSADEDVPLHAS